MQRPVTAAPTATPFEAIRMRCDSARSFDDVKTALLAQMGTIKPQDLAALIGAAQGRADFERALLPFTGNSGFMLFFEIDHSRWLPLYGIETKAVRFVFGNPAIAATLLRHDVEAGLFAPVELLLRTADAGDGSTILYDLPSSLMGAQKDPQFLKAAQGLDAKIEALVRAAAA